MDAIKSFIHTENVSKYIEICNKLKESRLWIEPNLLLKMYYKSLQENILNTKLIYACIKTNNLSKIDKFILGLNIANI